MPVCHGQAMQTVARESGHDGTQYVCVLCGRQTWVAAPKLAKAVKTPGAPVPAKVQRRMFAEAAKGQRNSNGRIGKGQWKFAS